MPYSLRDFDPDKPMDVPTMMKMLTLVHQNALDNEFFEDVADAVGGAICILNNMQDLARQVMVEGSTEIEFPHLPACCADKNLC